jgi:hypothetical protein
MKPFFAIRKPAFMSGRRKCAKTVLSAGINRLVH